MQQSDATNVPNLDNGLTEAELWAFWRKHSGGRNAKDLFPAGGKGSRRATQDLANYASNKATAMACRKRGEVNQALMYERICDDIYEALPDLARGW